VVGRFGSDPEVEIEDLVRSFSYSSNIFSEYFWVATFSAGTQ